MSMTNRIALILAIIIIALIVWDHYWMSGRIFAFVVTELFRLIEYMAFWR